MAYEHIGVIVEIIQIVLKLVSIPFLFNALGDLTSTILMFSEISRNGTAIIINSIGFILYSVGFFLLFFQPKWIKVLFGNNIMNIKIENINQQTIIGSGIILISVYFIIKYGIYLFSFIIKYALSFVIYSIYENESVVKDATYQISSVVGIIVGVILIVNGKKIKDKIE